MKHIATAVVAMALLSACAEADTTAHDESYEAIEADADATQEPSQHFVPAEPPNDGEMAADSDAE